MIVDFSRHGVAKDRSDFQPQHVAADPGCFGFRKQLRHTRRVIPCVEIDFDLGRLPMHSDALQGELQFGDRSLGAVRPPGQNAKSRTRQKGFAGQRVDVSRYGIVVARPDFQDQKGSQQARGRSGDLLDQLFKARTHRSPCPEPPGTTLPTSPTALVPSSRRDGLRR